MAEETAYGPMTVPVTTERLVLRPFTRDDVDDMYAYQGLPGVAKYLYRPPRTRERCAEVVAELADGPVRWQEVDDSVVLAVCRRGEPGVVGEVMVKLANVRAGQTEIGWVFNPAHGGRGYATEAARALAALAFDRLGTHRLFARLDAENTASARVCERLGMRKEAHLVESDLRGDEWGSELVYAALAHELIR
ncbi:GNAT family N-acetyltransferase [Streptantibioticus cattleyicolor]|uniref:Acetyltransferase n=1 Tax=Streptantibioticus cattleyicolor (strain ATCC 35852 / DSM 46488 / JCM 4925 / NBRC 14057 / NRRL 8057) TaxID=1003195 RepID=F8JMN5_STREN|nr:GNAT family N-acetyltransferase [Streptantibioticus cattleyicolor]AEW98828.1 acetyltransferase [Streptantibioticus cattleyicolor NRRL 8057 = DSM 46488]CCB72124.1 putative acetyltransferase [Streptantibioticus cattleyicolor NRRL 8057 = DSM 46488]